MRRHHALRVVYLGVATALLTMLIWHGDAPYGGSILAGDAAPPLRLADDDGGHFDLAQQHGHIVLVTFGYTHCPDVCPTILSDLSAATAQLGADAAQVRTVFVTIDPARDTPMHLHDYLANFFTPPGDQPLGLTDTPGQTAAAARAWGVAIRRSAGGAFFDHTAMVAAVGPDGRLRLRYGFSQLQDASAVANDLWRLIRGG